MSRHMRPASFLTNQTAGISRHLLSASLLALCVSTQASAEVKWLLPTPVQSDIEIETDVARTGWQLPTRPAFVRDSAGRERVTKTERPDIPLFDPGTVVTTGFSGTILKKPLSPRGQPEPDRDDPKFRFLDPNGVVAALTGADGIGFAYNGAELTRLPYDRILARDVGQVFGLAIDNDMFRNLYLTASSAYGLNIVGADSDNDKVPDRLVIGDPSARWMPAQWGTDMNAGPGSVWKVDGETGQITLFANITLDGLGNAGAGLGNIAFDALHDQLFVSDLQTGMIHRLDLSGQDLESFDHGMDGRGDDPQIPFVPTGTMDIADPSFDTEDPTTWGFADPARRVWGLAVNGARVYYGVADGPAVHSVGLDPETGAFLNDARWEFSVSNTASNDEITDLVFAGDGALIVAQRGERLGAFDHEKLTRARGASVLRYVYEDPADPDTPSAWVEQPQEYPVGFAATGRNTLGGVAVGPRYDETGSWDTRACGATLWSTGEALRNNPRLQGALEIGGELAVDGVQAQPVWMNRTGNTPPWEAYFMDYDTRYDGPRVTGHVGDVEVLGCRGAGGMGDDYAYYDDPPFGDGFDDGDDDIIGGGDCTTMPWLCPPPQPPCMDVTAVAVCDPTTGSYAMAAKFEDTLGNGLDAVKVMDPTGTLGGLPVEQSLTQVFLASLAGLAPGQPAQLNLCGYRAADRLSGEPYGCCNATVSITTPDAACEKESE